MMDSAIYFESGSGCTGISCAYDYPFNTYCKGDYLEIDLDECYHNHIFTKYKDTNIVRKAGSVLGTVTIKTTPSSAVDVARSVTQVMVDQADRTGAVLQCQIEQNTGNMNLFYHPKK
jgi:hypothetical protein